jgi:hypothetical protein
MSEKKSKLKSFIAWLDKPNYNGEENFLSKAISSGSSLARTLILLFFVLTLLYLITTNLVDRILGDGGEMSYSPTGNLIISNKKKEKIQVLSVPAYQNFTATGIEFNKVNKLTIRTTGLISTGLQVPGFKKEELLKQSDNLSKLNERLSKLEFHPGWREANGHLIQNFKSDNDRNNCNDNKSREKRILPGKEYGTLLGFFADDDSKAKEMLRNKKNQSDFFIVGKKAEIILNSSSKKVIITSSDEKDPKSFDLDKVKGYLYFTINDSIIRNDKDFDMFNECAKKSDKEEKEQAEEKVNIYKELYNDIDDNNGDKATIWFMDNRGNFTVNIFTNLQ